MSISPLTLTSEPTGVPSQPLWAPLEVVAPAEPVTAAPPVPPKSPTAAPPEVHAHQAHFEDLGFLESARMDREMARELHQSAWRPRSGLSITAALMNMSNRRFLTLGAGVLLLTIGLLALRLPVFLADFDQWGFQISCGSGLASSVTQAGIADSAGTHFVDQCQTAIAMRRAWAVPFTVAGMLLIGGLLVTSPRQRSRTPS
jgi:hypothetical protein